MGSYNTAVITTVGQALLTSVLGSQGTMTFTKLQTSSYSYASGTDLSALTSLNNVEQEVNVGSATIVDSTHISAGATISNSGISTEYNVNTLGIFASDGNNEVLFAVSTAVTPDVIPVDQGGTPSTYKYKFTLAVSSTADITISAVGDITANDVSFDNTTSGLPATDVQTAIDEIDAEVDDITKRLSGQSNRNILVNGWFTVNQRGQSSYNITTAHEYTLDCWFVNNAEDATSTLDINSDGSITLTNTNPTSTNYIVFVNKFEDYICKSLIGKPVTFSIKTNTGIYSKTWVPVAGSESFLDLPNGWRFSLITYPHLGINENYVRVWTRSGGAVGTPITIYAVKLEEGSVSTLAYDVAPNYAEELAKCQRYQIAIPFVIGTLISTGVVDNYGSIWFPISIGTVPRINNGHFSLLSGSIRVHDDTTYTEVTSSGSVSYNATCAAQGNILGIQIGGLTPLKTYSLDSSTGGTMLFDFNI